MVSIAVKGENMITIQLQKGNSFAKIDARTKRAFFRAIMKEIGAKGGRKSTPAKREAALKREAKKRTERGL